MVAISKSSFNCLFCIFCLLFYEEINNNSIFIYHILVFCFDYAFLMLYFYMIFYRFRYYFVLVYGSLPLLFSSFVYLGFFLPFWPFFLICYLFYVFCFSNPHSLKFVSSYKLPNDNTIKNSNTQTPLMLLKDVPLP